MKRAPRSEAGQVAVEDQMIRTLIVVVGIYLGIVALVATLQTRMLFPTGLVPRGDAPPAAAVPLTVGTADGQTLAGFLLPGDDGRAEAGAEAGAEALPLLLGFGGNAWNAAAVAGLLRAVFPQHPVAAFEYRGYGASTGKPSAQAIMDDAEAVFDQLAPQAPGGIIPVGISIGTGPAARLVAAREVQGAVLVTPFDSLGAVARDTFPWLPVGLFFRHDMPVADMLADSTVPIAAIIAGNDSIIPARRSHALLDRLPSPAHVTTIGNVGHNDIFGDPRFGPALRDAVAAVTRPIP
jgi:uncharacterized protein